MLAPNRLKTTSVNIDAHVWEHLRPKQLDYLPFVLMLLKIRCWDHYNNHREEAAAQFVSSRGNSVKSYGGDKARFRPGRSDRDVLDNVHQ